MRGDERLPAFDHAFARADNSTLLASVASVQPEKNSVKKMRAMVPFTKPIPGGCRCGGACGSCGGHGSGAPYMRRGFQGLGAVDLSQYNVAQKMLSTANANLQALAMAYANNPTAFPATFGNQLIEAQQRYTTILQAYIYAYGLAVGSPPNTTGLEGLGQWQTYVAAGVGIVAILAALYELNRFISVLQTQAQNAPVLTAQANIAGAQAALAAANASGDPTEIATAQANFDTITAAEANSLTPPPTSGSWLANNWPILAGGVLAIFLVRDLV